MTTEKLPRLLKAREVSEALGIPKWRIYKLVQDGGMPAVRLGRSVRFDEKALAKWLQGGGTAAVGEDQ